MNESTNKQKKIPTIRYRVLAIVFFVLAAAGLFLGLLGNFVSLFKHTGLALFPYMDAPIAVNNASLLKGSLFGYVYDMLKYFFTGGLHFTDLGVVIELLALVQVLLIPVAVLASLAFMIAACATKGQAPRALTLASGILVTVAYLWPVATILFVGHAEEGTLLKGLGMAFSVDFSLLTIALASLVILCVVGIMRRKLVGLFNVLCTVLMLVAVVAIAYPSVYTVYITATLGGLYLNDALLAYLFVALMAVLAFNVVLAIARLSAKRCYVFDAVRYGVLFAVVVAVQVMFIVKKPDGLGQWDLFTNKVNLATCLTTYILLGTALVALALAIVNCVLVSGRRRTHKERRVAEKVIKEKEPKKKNETVTETPAPAKAPALPVVPRRVPAAYAAPQYPVMPQMPPMNPYYQQPIIVQQAPASPPIVVLQVPGQNDQGQVIQQFYQQPFPPQPAPQPQPAPAPAPQPEPAEEPSAFAQRMTAYANATPAPAPEPAPAPAPQPAPAPAPQPTVENIYYGPYDEFMSTLTDPQKREFGDLFIAKLHGDFGLPEYTIGGDNKKFFARVFISLGKFRQFISAELLSKIYDYANK